jgi:hypothetical protein
LAGVWATVLLAVLVWGVGHFYLGLVQRGIIILIIGAVLAIVLPWFIPVTISWIIIIGYWAWQIWDVYKHYEKLNKIYHQNF